MLSRINGSAGSRKYHDMKTSYPSPVRLPLRVIWTRIWVVENVSSWWIVNLPANVPCWTGSITNSMFLRVPLVALTLPLNLLRSPVSKSAFHVTPADALDDPSRTPASRPQKTGQARAVRDCISLQLTAAHPNEATRLPHENGVCPRFAKRHCPYLAVTAHKFILDQMGVRATLSPRYALP